MSDPRPQRAVIIGASSGIGREMALRLAASGWRVCVIGRRGDLLAELADLAPDHLLPLVFDVDAVDAIPARLGEAEALLGGMDLLVISAGTGFLNPDLAPALEARTVATNVAAFTALADWGYNHFKKQGNGQLAAITSVGGLIGEGGAPAYSASKAYQIMYLAGLAKRARKENPGCAVTELRPGSVNTDMMKGEGHFWITQPAAAAEIACRAIQSKKRLQYISPRWSLIGLALRLASLFS